MTAPACFSRRHPVHRASWNNNALPFPALLVFEVDLVLEHPVGASFLGKCIGQGFHPPAVVGMDDGHAVFTANLRACSVICELPMMTMPSKPSIGSLATMVLPSVTMMLWFAFLMTRPGYARTLFHPHSFHAFMAL
jgi:hypothetical protein